MGTDRPGPLHLRLLCHFKRIINLDAEIANRTFQLGVPEQQLHGAQVLRVDRWSEPRTRLGKSESSDVSRACRSTRPPPPVSVGDFELDRPLCLLLQHDRAGRHCLAMANIRTRNFTRSHARSLLSIAEVNSAMPIRRSSTATANPDSTRYSLTLELPFGQRFCCALGSLQKRMSATGHGCIPLLRNNRLHPTEWAL